VRLKIENFFPNHKRFHSGSGFDPMESSSGGNGLPIFPSSSDGNDASDYHSRSPESSFSIDDKSSPPSTPRDFSVSPKMDDLEECIEMNSSAVN
jgi:hypothetical protein